MINKKKNILIFILILFLFEPTICIKYSFFNFIFIVGGVISLIYIINIYIKNNIYVNNMIICLIVFNIINVLSTMYYAGDILKVGYTAMIIVSLFLYANYFYREKKFDIFINILCKILNLYLLINIVTFIIWPNGINELLYPGVFFLGFRTRFTEYAISAALLSFVNYKNGMINKKRCISNIIIAFLNIMLPKVGTAIVGCIIFVISYIFYRKMLNNKILIKYDVFYIFILILMIGIVFFRVHNCLEFVFVNVLGKDITLTGRTEIWDSALDVIKKSNIVFGNGYVENGNFVPYGINSLYQAHNQILQILYETGIVGLILFLKFINYIVCSKNDSVSNVDIVIVSVIYAILVMMTVEIYSYYISAYIPFILFFYRNGIHCCREKELNEN